MSAGSRGRVPDALSISPLAPWSADSRRYAYEAFDRGKRSGRLHLADIEGPKVSAALSGYVAGLFWSPAEPLFLLLGASAANVVDERGVSLARLSWTVPQGEVLSASGSPRVARSSPSDGSTVARPRFAFTPRPATCSCRASSTIALPGRATH